MGQWVWANFLGEDSPLYNPDHEHLNDASILYLWSSESFKRQGQAVVGTAQMFRGLQGAMGKKELLQMIYRNFHRGEEPDFIITLSAPYVMQATPKQRGRLLDHEHYHCAINGYDGRGKPIWRMQGHDYEFFKGEIRRYGVGDGYEELRTLMNRKPDFTDDQIETALCGCGHSF